jgi:hypothetical protein
MSSPSELSARFATILGLVIGAGIAIMSPADDLGATGTVAAPMTTAVSSVGRVRQEWGNPLRTAAPSRGMPFELIPDQY